MRIIGGFWRSRKLARPVTAATRPMPDRVRQAVFDVLGSHFDVPGALPDIIVADVFAGGGSLGLEALSRGAASCCFFERDRTALVALRTNIDSLDAQARSQVIVQDAWESAISTPEGGSFDLVFLDPPYADSNDSSPAGAVYKYLERLAGNGTDPLVVIHHNARVRYAAPLPGSWKVMKHRTFGTNAVTYFTT